MEKDQIIELTIEDMLDDGRGFGRTDEGAAVFISGGAPVRNAGAGQAVKAAGCIPGDRVRVRISRKKKNSAEAAPAEITEASPDRIKAQCPYAGRCGGCTLQEMAYDAQKRLKRRQTGARLERLGGLKDPEVREIIGAESLKYYRNKAEFKVGPHGEVGFVRGKSHQVIDIIDCLLQTDPAMVCADALREFLRRTGTGCISQMMVRTAFGTGEVMAVIESGKKDIPQIELLAEMLDDAVYSLAGEGHDEIPRGTDPADADDAGGRYTLESLAVIHKGRCRIIAGRPTITEEFIRDDGSTVRFEISPQSFFQVNPEQMVRLYDKAAEYAALEGGELVLDLYCGAGTIGIWLLNDLRSRDEEAFSRTRVIGIESVKSAVLDANRNTVINGLVNTRYICGRAEEELPGMMGLAKLYKWNEVNERVEREPEIRIDRADVAVLDPPRAGCDEALLDAVVKAGPERIVYVSCDSATLARDIRYLTERGYEFVECTPVDQFIWTSHIEAVAKIQRR